MHHRYQGLDQVEMPIGCLSMAIILAVILLHLAGCSRSVEIVIPSEPTRNLVTTHSQADEPEPITPPAPGSLHTAPLGVTSYATPRTAPTWDLASITLDGYTLRLQGLHQDVTYAIPRPGEITTIRADSTGALKADILGRPEPLRQQVEITEAPGKMPAGARVLIVIAMIVIGIVGLWALIKSLD